MNDTDDPQVHAHLGLVRIPAGSCCEGQRWEEYTPEEASRLTVAISVAIRDARDQLRAIKEACAQGHVWSSGYNRAWGDKTTVYHCTREGCDGRKEEPGWLPFEPKQHLVPFASKLLDCTGPGCEWCDQESSADAFNRLLGSATKKLNDEFLPLLGDKAAGLALAFDTTPVLEAKKHGAAWHIDATPGQVQAALDARNKATVEAYADHAQTYRAEEAAAVTQGQPAAPGYCDCGHRAAQHGQYGFGCTHCACGLLLEDLASRLGTEKTQP